MNNKLRTTLWAIGSAVTVSATDTLVAQLQSDTFDWRRLLTVAAISALITVRALMATPPSKPQ